MRTWGASEPGVIRLVGAEAEAEAESKAQPTLAGTSSRAPDKPLNRMRSKR